MSSSPPTSGRARARRSGARNEQRRAVVAANADRGRGDRQHAAPRAGRASHDQTPPRPAAPAPVEVPSGPGSFAELGVPVALCQELARQGVLEAFPIQTSTLPDSLAGRDVLGRGRTGSGKTLAFALPIVARLAATRRPAGKHRPRALVLVPTRELAAQVEDVIAPLAAVAGLRTTSIYGGVGMGPQLAALRAGVEIVIGCPGRLADHMDRRSLDLGAVEITVLDEADHMADAGFLPTVRRLLDTTPQRGQRLLFSATLDRGVDQVVQRYLHDPVSHAVADEAPIDVAHHVIVVAADDRTAVVASLAHAHKSVVFTRTKHRAKQLTRLLAAGGLSAVELHGNLSQQARTRNLDAFVQGRARVLVATDIAARGIHVDQVPLVVHADPPIEHKAYVHRSGRTARAGASGTVVTIATGDQVDEVTGLLRRATIEATWSQVGSGTPDAIAVLDGRGQALDRTAAARTSRAATRSTTTRGAASDRPDASRPARSGSGRRRTSRPPTSNRSSGRR